MNKQTQTKIQVEIKKYAQLISDSTELDLMKKNIHRNYDVQKVN